MMSCAPTVVERPKIDLVWPLPPEEPRIKYVDLIKSTIDLGKKSGVVETLFGADDAVSFEKPYGVAVDKDERIYVTDIGKVIVMDLRNKTYDLIGAQTGTGQLRVPIGVGVTRDGRVFVTDTAHAKVFVYTLQGKLITALGHAGEMDNPSGVAFDEQRQIAYVVDTNMHAVFAYSLSDYSKIRTIGERGEDPGLFNFPSNIAVDREGKLYVVDSGNFRVQIFDHTGKFIRTFGKLGDFFGAFARPKGIAVDSDGHIYVVDTAFRNFQIFDQEGQLLLFVGEGGLEPGKFVLPAGIAIDDNDKIYIVDQIPGLVQIFQYLGEKKQKGP